MGKVFQTTCYRCSEKIYGISNKFGGTFYKDSPQGETHKKTCKYGFFNDNEQSKNVPIYKNNLIDPQQLKLIPDIKLCRICWNTNRWQKPSGLKGKSIHPSFEQEHGFGFDEWLFDLDKIANDGYQYSFLTPIYKYPEKYIGSTFNLTFYSINETDKKTYLVGNLNNVEIINKVKSAEIIELYKNSGWLDDMKNDLNSLNLDTNILQKWASENLLFNIRFKPNEITGINEYLQPINFSDINSYRYTLFDADQYKLPKLKDINKHFDFFKGSLDYDDLALNANKSFKEEHKELELKHSKLLSAFMKYLNKDFGDDIRRECVTYDNKRIDIVQKTNSGFIFYEIKTYNHLKTSLRIALGQLMEYSCYPENKYAEKLYLVSDLKPSEEFKNYLKHLKEIFNIPIGYIQFDLTDNKIVNQIN